jgi:hypothetical protein
LDNRILEDFYDQEEKKGILTANHYSPLTTPHSPIPHSPFTTHNPITPLFPSKIAYNRLSLSKMMKDTPKTTKSIIEQIIKK